MLPLHEEYRKVPLLAILLPMIFGIIVQEYFFLEIKWVFFSTIHGILILLVFFKLRFHSFLTFIFIFFASFSIGSYSTQLTQEKERPSEDFFNSEAYLGVIQDIPSLKNKKHHTLIRIEKYKYQGAWYNCSFLCQSIINDTTENKYLPAHQYVITSKISSPRNSIIPGQFDYENYLRFQGIFAVTYIKNNEIAFHSKKKHSWILIISDFRYKILKALSKDDIPKRERSILSSFILGYRGEIDPELNRAFASAGASHILSVSGMHVGIVYLFLNLLLQFLNESRNKRIIKSFIVIICIWFYAMLAGFSPPVLRSAFMFTLFAFADINTRKTININILAFSAIILLTINPYFLFDVGFQLSYAAMLGIFLIYVPLVDKWLPQHTLMKYFYSVLLLSFAAQVGTLPLILYYFQQFPSYFLLTNLLIVPWSAIILYLAIIYSVSLPIAFFSKIVAFLLKWAIFGLNQLVLQVEDLPGNVIQNFEFELFDSLIMALIIVMMIFFISRKKIPYLSFILIVLIVASLRSNQQLLSKTNKTETYAYFFNSKPIILVINGNEKYAICNVEIFKKINLKNFKWHDSESFSENKCHQFSLKNINKEQMLIKTEKNYIVMTKNNKEYNKILIFNKNYILLDELNLNYRKNEYFSFE